MPQERDDTQIILEPAENRLHDCAAIEVGAELDESEDLRVKLYAAFSDMWIELRVERFLLASESWRVNFAVRRVDLELLLNNLKSPPAKRRLRKALMDPGGATITHTTTEGYSNESSHSSQAEVAAEFSSQGMKTGPKLSLGRSQRSSRHQSSADEYRTPMIDVESKGDTRTPKWILRSRASDAELRGEMRTELAALEVNGLPSGAIVWLRTSYRSIKITEVDSPKFDRLSEKKKRLVGLTIRDGIYEECKDYLSRAEIRYDYRK